MPTGKQTDLSNSRTDNLVLANMAMAGIKVKVPLRLHETILSTRLIEEYSFDVLDCNCVVLIYYFGNDLLSGGKIKRSARLYSCNVHYHVYETPITIVEGETDGG